MFFKILVSFFVFVHFFSIFAFVIVILTGCVGLFMCACNFVFS